MSGESEVYGEFIDLSSSRAADDGGKMDRPVVGVSSPKGGLPPRSVLPAEFDGDIGDGIRFKDQPTIAFQPAAEGIVEDVSAGENHVLGHSHEMNPAQGSHSAPACQGGE